MSGFFGVYAKRAPDMEGELGGASLDLSAA